jgi:hypothetical protein
VDARTWVDDDEIRAVVVVVIVEIVVIVVAARREVVGVDPTIRPGFGDGAPGTLAVLNVDAFACSKVPPPARTFTVVEA